MEHRVTEYKLLSLTMTMYKRTPCGDKFLNLFRPPLTPPNLGGEMATLVVVPAVVSTFPPKLGGVRGGLNNRITP